MHPVRVRAPHPIEAGFARIRRQLGVPEGFPPEVEAEAAAAQPVPALTARRDARDVALVAIDPAGSTDLDQALCLERRDGGGYRFRYAIADVGAFVAAGGAIDAEARRRGVTLYSPDGRAPLHPTVLSEQRASLLPGTDKAALLWTIDLDGWAEPVSWHLERAVVRTRAAISYPRAQAHIDGRAPLPPEIAGSVSLLAVVGAKRQAREEERGGISLNLPTQRVEEDDGGYRLAFEQPLAVEGWNAQLSLLTGIVAGRTMVESKVGILRTLPAAPAEAIATLRQTARALGLSWPAEQPYPAFVRSLAGDASPAAGAFLIQAAHTLRGAGYVGFDGTVPDRPGHGAIASVYAHVTAPLRRLVDRFGNEILLALYAGVRPPGWALEALDELPTLMGQAGQRESALERALLDYTEAVVLAPRVGQRYTGTVVDVGRNRTQVQITEPAVVTMIEGERWQLAQHVSLELTAANPDTGTISFRVA